MTRRVLTWMVCLGSLLGCGRLQFEPTPPIDGSMQEGGSNDGSMDATMDATSDASFDAALDAISLDATVDSGDATSDTGADDDANVPIDAGQDADVPRDLDYCAQVPALRNAPTIDGVLEPGLLLRAITPVDWTSAIELFPTDQPSSYAVAWRPNGLYFYVKVVDPTRLPALPADAPWTGDGAEVYVDSDGIFTDAPMYDLGARQLCTAAPSDDVTPVARGEGFRDAVSFGPWAPGNWNAFPTPDGYVLEALVLASDLMIDSWTLSSGGHVGFDISINVSGPTFTPDPDAGVVYPRVGQYFLKISSEPDVCVGRPYCQPLAFCAPMLID